MRDKKTDLERSVEDYLVNQVEKRGGICKKFMPDYSIGFPDRVLMLPGGKLVWVETKRPVGGKPSVAQLVQHATLRALGQRVEVVCSRSEVDSLLDEIAPTVIP